MWCEARAREKERFDEVYWFHSILFAGLDWNMTTCSHEWIHYLNCALCHRFMSSLSSHSTCSHFFDVIWLDWCRTKRSIRANFRLITAKPSHTLAAVDSKAWPMKTERVRRDWNHQQHSTGECVKRFHVSSLSLALKFIYSRSRAFTALHTAHRKLDASRYLRIYLLYASLPLSGELNQIQSD